MFDKKAYAKEWSRKDHINVQFDAEKFTKKLLNSSRACAKDRGIPYHLTYDILYEALVNTNGICSVSGKHLTTLHNHLMKASIDRIDSNKGYTKNNIQIVGQIVNKSKNIMSMEEYIDLCKSVVKHNG
jgi:hypothetical protein